MNPLTIKREGKKKEDGGFGKENGLHAFGKLSTSQVYVLKLNVLMFKYFYFFKKIKLTLYLKAY